MRITQIFSAMIPQKGEDWNSHRGHVQTVLRTFPALVAVLALALPAAASAGLTRSESSLLRQMNHVRAVHGLRPLRCDLHLERAARAHTHEMLLTNIFSHGAFGSRMLQFNVRGSTAGENLAWATGSRGSAAGLVAAWLASPAHRANLLEPSFTRVGIGELVGSFQGLSGAHVVTTDFAG
jgi:uncharacterized protein YkwD